jgi:hypothetical protein
MMLSQSAGESSKSARAINQPHPLLKTVSNGDHTPSQALIFRIKTAAGQGVALSGGIKTDFRAAIGQGMTVVSDGQADMNLCGALTLGPGRRRPGDPVDGGVRAET